MNKRIHSEYMNGWDANMREKQDVLVVRSSNLCARYLKQATLKGWRDDGALTNDVDKMSLVRGEQGVQKI